MITLRTDKQIYDILVHRMAVAVTQLHKAKDEHGKDSLIWRWRYALVGNAGRRVQEIEQRRFPSGNATGSRD